MLEQALVAWYRGRHVSTGRESDPWVIATFVATLVLIVAAYGAWLHPVTPPPPPPSDLSGNVEAGTQTTSQRVVTFALSQVGSPYTWGSTGPYKEGYDSSGLVMTAWAHAGVSIPRDGYGMWSKLPHISKADLRPGDVLMYDGFDHVAMYIGDNDIIDAPQAGEDVEVISMNTPRYAKNFYGAVRP
jgi:cell wall-associated NlpC family hydrolase